MGELKMARLYDHDCDRCVFLGTYTASDPGGPVGDTQTYDLYACPGEPTVIARASSEDSDYYSGLTLIDTFPPLKEAATRAALRGLIRMPVPCTECGDSPWGHEQHPLCIKCRDVLCTPCVRIHALCGCN